MGITEIKRGADEAANQKIKRFRGVEKMIW